MTFNPALTAIFQKQFYSFPRIADGPEKLENQLPGQFPDQVQKFLLLMVFIILLPFFSTAKKMVVISGFEPAYRGYQIELFRYADAISKEKMILASFKIKDDGSFCTSFELEANTYCMSVFDAYQASVFLVPGKNYEISFPPLRKIQDSQKRNPFFKKDDISFALKNAVSKDINHRIQHFEMAYLEEESRYFNMIYHQKLRSAVDSLENHLQKLFPETNDPYFEDYKFYRTAFAEFALRQGQSENFVKKCFVSRQPNLEIPPCAKLFEQLFTNYFLFEGNKLQENFRTLVARSDLSGIEDYLIKKNNWNKNLARLVILQSIKDAYSGGQFSQVSLLRLLDQIVSGDWETDKKIIAGRLKTRLTYLKPGSQAPDFIMSDFSDKQYHLGDFKNKYIYLHFTHVANPIGRQHLDELKKIAANFEKELQVINLILPEEADKKDLILQQNWGGAFYIVDEKTADTYRVTNFPAAFLIDHNGRLIWSPAPNPLDGLEQQFLSLLRQKRAEEIRDQNK